MSLNSTLKAQHKPFPIIDVLIPAYNEEARLEAPLRSYLAFARTRADLDIDLRNARNGPRQPHRRLC